MSVWINFLFNLTAIINLIVAFFFPFDQNEPLDRGAHDCGPSLCPNRPEFARWS